MAKGDGPCRRSYSATRCFPKEEVYALTNQLRRASVSIPSNIAEGQGRRTTADFCRHLSIAYGSLREVETQIMIAQRLNYLSETAIQPVLQMTGEVGPIKWSNAVSARIVALLTAHSPLPTGYTVAL